MNREGQAPAPNVQEQGEALPDNTPAEAVCAEHSPAPEEPVLRQAATTDTPARSQGSAAAGKTVNPGTLTTRDWLALACAVALSALWFAVFGILGGSSLAPGLGVTVFTVALLGTVCGLLGRQARWSRATAALLAAIAALALIPAIFADSWLCLLNLPVLFGATVLEIGLLTGFARAAWYRGCALWHSLRSFLSALVSHLATPLRSVQSLPGKAVKRSSTLKGIGLGLLIAAIVLTVVLPLLISADAVFGQFFDIGRLFKDVSGMDVWRVLRIVLATPIVFSALLALRRGCRYTELAALKAGDARVEKRIAAAPLITALVVLDIVYLMFCGIQFMYLFAGTGPVGAAGGYAAYARTGFFQLVAVAAINLAVVLLALRLWQPVHSNKAAIAAGSIADAASTAGVETSGGAPADATRQHAAAQRGVRMLMLVMLCGTAVILASAAFRMSLYVDAYGLSLLRALTYLGMAFIAVLLAAAAIKVFRRGFPFFGVFLAAGLALWLTFNFCNVDARIADYNVNAYLEGRVQTIDASYLCDLSPTTLPALERLAAEDPSYSDEIAYCRSHWRVTSRDASLNWTRWSWQLMGS